MGRRKPFDPDRPKARLIVFEHYEDGARSVMDICERPMTLLKDGRMSAYDKHWWSKFTMAYDGWNHSMTMEIITPSKQG